MAEGSGAVSFRANGGGPGAKGPAPWEGSEEKVAIVAASRRAR